MAEPETATPAISPDARIDIVLPDGQSATVPAKDYDAALAAGAKPAPTEPTEDSGGLAGAAAAGVLGAGSTATFGLTDRALATGSGLAGGLIGGNVQAGKAFRHEVTSNLQAVRERNPGSTMVGEGAGLFLNPAGISGLGEAVEEGVGARVGESLLGRMTTGAARFGAENAALGAQHQITEDTLGDHDINGQKVFASAAKDGVIGVLAGGAFGAAGHAFGGMKGLLSRGRGPASDAALDEVAGLSGAGRATEENARATQSAVEDLRKSGMTGDQAAKVVDDIKDIVETHAKGPVSGPIGSVIDSYAERVSDSPQLRDVLRRVAEDADASATKTAASIDSHAQSFAHKGTETMRELDDHLNRIHFTEKSEQIAKVVDASRVDLQRDAVAKAMQDVDEGLKFWESTASKGGEASGALKSIRNQWKDTLDTLYKADEQGAESLSKDLFIRTNKLKQGLDRFSRYGQDWGLPEAIMHEDAGIRSMANKLRGTLEDGEVWGEKAAAQHAALNESFSTAQARTMHFKDTLGVRIDQQAGKSLPEIDFQKSHNMFSQLRGNDIDNDLQAVKSTQAYIDGMKSRLASVREHATLTPADAKQLAKGESALANFEKAFTEGRKEVAIVNQVKAQRLDEQGKGLGGLVGLVGDIMTKPATTVERLAQVRNTVKNVEDGVTKALGKFFDAKGPATSTAERLTPHPRSDVIKDIGEVRKLANDPNLQARLNNWVGDLTKHAPQTAESVKATAARAIAYLAQEAPPGMVSASIIALHNQKPRYSDQQLSSWATKRDAVLGRNGVMGPEVIVSQMHQGKLNRDAIKAIQTVSPALYQQLQSAAQEELKRLAGTGKLDHMPYQRQAALASLLQVPAGETWQPDFMQMMQAAKATPAQTGDPKQTGGVPGSETSKRKITLDPKVFMTETGRIEQGGVA
jgi:hypothetical protein